MATVTPYAVISLKQTRLLFDAELRTLHDDIPFVFVSSHFHFENEISVSSVHNPPQSIVKRIIIIFFFLLDFDRSGTDLK